MLTPPITAWSNSRLDIFEACAFRAHLQFGLKIPDPSPKEAANRGLLLHTDCENVIQKGTELTPGIEYARPRLEILRTAFLEGKVEVENNWGLDTNWAQADFFHPQVWGRVKLDACHHTSPETAVVIDWKSGKKWGNEVKHMLQAQTYEITTFMRYPALQEITTIFNYLDQKTETIRTITRERALKALPALDKRARRLTTATVFRANPNKHTCHFCPYKPSGTNDCKIGVD